MRNITILELRPYASSVASTPASLSRLCCHRSSGGQLSFCAAEGGRQRPSSAHSSSLSGFHHSSIHLSVHSSLHPSVHIAYCCTCGSIRHKTVVACRFTYRLLCLVFFFFFQILDEINNPVASLQNGDISRCTEFLFLF